MKDDRNISINCLEARRSILTEPKNRSESLLKHLDSCNTCASFFGRHSVFEEQLQQALEVEVSENLEARILLAQKVGEKQTSKTQHRRWYALAASVVLSLAVVVSMVTLNRTPKIESLVMEHVYYDHVDLDQSRPLQLIELNTILGQHGIQMQKEIGPVYYAKDCLIDGKLAAHVVMADDGELVTIYFMSNEKISKRIEFGDGNYQGVIMPALRGSVAIISKRMPSVIDMERKLSQVTTYDL